MLMYGNILKYVRYVNNRIEGNERKKERENCLYDLIVWCKVLCDQNYRIGLRNEINVGED